MGETDNKQSDKHNNTQAQTPEQGQKQDLKQGKNSKAKNKKQPPLVHIDYNLVDTTLDKNTDFEGELNFEHSLKINGRYKGKINTPGFLYVGKSAVVEADIEADVVILEGSVRGDVYAHDKIEMMSTGKLYGDLTTSKLQISDGVVFEGNCTMIKEKAG